MLQRYEKVLELCKEKAKKITEGLILRDDEFDFVSSAQGFEVFKNSKDFKVSRMLLKAPVLTDL